MNHRTKYALLALLLSGTLLAGCTGSEVLAGGGQTALVTAEPVPATISVTGTGIATATPDIAYVTLGVESRDPDASEAVADSTTRMQAVMEVLEEYGIAANDIETVSYTMWLEQPPRPEPVPPSVAPVETEERYHVVNQIRVALRDLDRVGDLLGDVLAAGANNVAGVQFAVEDTTALLEEARSKAIEDAESKAEQYAEGFGTIIKGVYSLTELSAPGRAYAAAEVYGIGGGGAPVPVASGELSVSVSVQAAYEIVH